MRTPTKSPGVLSAFITIALMDTATRVGGMRRALSLARRLGGNATGGKASSGFIDSSANAVATAAAFYPRRALCLEQSLALYVLLRRRGIPAEIRIGVRPLPFYAHAWVEVEGCAVNEQQGVIEQLVAFQHVGV